MEKVAIDSSRNNLMCRLCLTTTNIQLLSNIIDLANVWPDKINKLTGIDVSDITSLFYLFIYLFLFNFLDF